MNARPSRIRIWVAALAVVAPLVVVFHQRGAVGQQSLPASGAGQTRTLLPDGRWLVIGPGAALVDPARGATTFVPGLAESRLWHTATLLPDGQVIVLGGQDARGRLVRQAERFNPATGTFATVTVQGWNGAAGHSATLLNDHEVLLAGGVRGDGVSDEVQRLDLTALTVTTVAGLDVARAYHTASLMADGRVSLWGGQNAERAEVNAGVVIDPTTGDVAEVFVPPADDATFYVAASTPPDGAAAVGSEQSVTIRFSRPIATDSLLDSVTLVGPAGDLSVTRVIAEAGRLLFVTPREPLKPDTPYVVSLAGLRDAAGALTLGSVGLTFRTAPSSSQDDRRYPPSAPDPEGEVWNPSVIEAWRTGRADSPWRDMPPLRASAGVTAVSGQMLRLNGQALAGVLVEMDGRSSYTDRAGRFLIAPLDGRSGWRELWIDGRPASRPNRTYGTFETGVHVTAGRTIVLPYTIWMPVIDTAHAIPIPSPTTAETVITTPTMPGLELRLPPGAVIRDHEGRVVTSVSLTPIPLDRPPFPLPEHVDVPIYFTIQPGGAYVSVSGQTTGYTQGARITYPNALRRSAGSPMEFWHYDPEDGRGWYVYGTGTVTPDGRQIAPDPGVSIHEFAGAMVAPSSLAAMFGRMLGNFFGWGGDPVDLGTGLFILDKTDLELPDTLPLTLQRWYRPNDTRSRAFGIGSSHLYDMFLVGDTFPYTYVDLILPDGARVHYTRISAGTNYWDAVYEHTSSPTAWFKSQVRWNGRGWNLTTRDGTLYVFPEAFSANRPQQAALLKIQDRRGNLLTVMRNSHRDITRVIAPHGRWLDFTYDSSFRVTRVADNLGREVLYQYDTSGRLWKVTDALGGVTEYTYDSNHRMLTLKDARGIVYLTNEYDANGRVSRQTQADETTYEFAYTLDGAGKVTEAEVTDPRGHIRRVTFNAAGYSTSQTEALGTALARTTNLTRQANTNLLLSLTDPLSRKTAYTYDSMGNPTSVTRLADTSEAVTTSLTFESTFNQVASVTNPLNHTTTFGYDAEGNLTTVTAPLNRQTTVTYDGLGLPLSVTNALGHTTSLGYVNGDLATVTDPLGQTSSQVADAGGRVVATTTPVGRTTQYEYNDVNQVTRLTDPVGAQTTLAYDPNGNLLSLTDALNHVTTYAYNTQDRVATRTDPLTHAETYEYDEHGNLTGRTDRQSQVTSYEYDALDRLTQVTFDDSSTITYTYDGGDRVTQIADSANGTITRTYDNLDRLTQETTAQGTVAYTYDADDRRATMTVAGQSTVSYSYDAADRLTAVTQGSSMVAISYDSGDRRSTLTFPNGIVAQSGYDNANQLTSLAYTLNQQTIGNLTYVYDAVGNRTGVSGLWARTGLPAALTSATYDAANRIVAWGGASFSYDLNGNLTNDGNKTYTWNARNQLTGLSGGASASFLYDGLARRRSKAISGTTTQFLYDGLNFVQEQNGSGTPTANLLTGLSLDETFTRTASAGTETVLVDALGSTLELADASGAVQTHYTFEAFGDTGISGTTSGNTTQFTGRENDGIGLYHYRARYYAPRLQRFLSEDPQRFGADLNFHAYAGNDPINFIDPTGEVFVPCRKQPCTFNPSDLGPTPLAALGPGARAAAAAAGRGFGAGFRGAPRAAAATTPKITVLGHWPGYTNLAQSIGARYFNVKPEFFARMTAAEQWAANARFLDRLILRGDIVVLSTPAHEARAGSWFAREIQYLTSHGYTLSPDGLRLLPPVR